MNCDKEPINLFPYENLPVDALEALPEEFIGVDIKNDPITGNKIYTPTRVKTSRLLPNATWANKLSLNPNNTELDVPDRQVLAGKVVSYSTTISIEKTATASDRVDFLLLGKTEDGRIVVQNTGFIVMPDGHDYIIGAQYFSGANGAPTTSGTHKLFVPISSTVLAVNIS